VTVLTTSHLGHNRIARDPAVIEACLIFVRGSQGAAAPELVTDRSRGN